VYAILTEKVYEVSAKVAELDISNLVNIKVLDFYKERQACGKRDSRFYQEEQLEEGFTKPGEWPWVVLIYQNSKYIGTGALVDKDVVVTVAHKVKDFVDDYEGLTVVLGDWNPNLKDEAERFPEVELRVNCVRLHPEADLGGTLANNVAVLKLDTDGSGTIPAPYINTICLPDTADQFTGYSDNCWVVAWGQDLVRQRKVDLPLVSSAECARRLGPLFKQKKVRNWSPQPSEVCAGGVPGKDACFGEGGAPLVCLDKKSDRYFAVGLVDYGFDCYKAYPAVYTNLADPTVQQFITQAYNNDNYC